MIELTHLAGRTVGVLGLGRSGLATARALLAGGAMPLAWDDAPAGRERAAAEGIAIADLTAADPAALACLVLSPGIPRAHPRPHPAVARALAAGCPVVGDIDLLGRQCPRAHFVGITGTNGKSTTTALLGHVLQDAGFRVEVGGNLGTPALALAPLAEDGWYVLELSSYQLESIQSIGWRVGVLLNLAPDHLDRYDGMGGYVAAKRRLVEALTPDGAAVIAVDDRWTRAIAAERRAAGSHVVEVSAERAVRGGAWIADGVLVDETQGRPEWVIDLARLPALPGTHNRQNAAAAYAAARLAGAAPAAIARAIASFPGLAHRQQKVGELDGVAFINDSKATNPAAAAKALVCYQRIHWIAGGRPKEGGFAELAPHLGQVSRAYLIGEAEPALAAFLEGKVAATRCGDVASAVRAAHAGAAAEGRGAVVLLSPACASYDQFTNFEARGEAFIRAVGTLVPAPAGERVGAAP
jgi:UDP-N-acetylmuramoylalanine--D-glutamate ligase